MQFAYCWRQPGSLFIGAAGEPGNYRRRLKPQGPAGRGGGGDVPAAGERRTRVEPGVLQLMHFSLLLSFCCGQRDPGGHPPPADGPFLGQNF